jgi:hypothetical protein
MSVIDPEAALYTYLSGLTGTVANPSTGVGARIYPGTAPQDSAYPRVTFHLITDKPDHYMSGASGISNATVQIDVWALDSLSRRAIGNLVKNAMDGLIGASMGGLRVGSVMLKDRRNTEEAPDNNSENAIFRMSMDFGVWRAEDIPTLS